MSNLALYRKAQRRWIKRYGVRCPYLAFVIAALEGRGIRLGALDVKYMVQEDIGTIAVNHLIEVIPEEE